MIDKNYWKERLEVINAFVNGETIQVYCQGVWKTCHDLDFQSESNKYRIKFKYRPYRPYKPNDNLYGIIGKSVVNKFSSIQKKIVSVILVDNRVYFCFLLSLHCFSKDSDYMFERFTYLDGSPFGIEEE